MQFRQNGKDSLMLRNNCSGRINHLYITNKKHALYLLKMFSSSTSYHVQFLLRLLSHIARLGSFLLEFIFYKIMHWIIWNIPLLPQNVCGGAMTFNLLDDIPQRCNRFVLIKTASRYIIYSSMFQRFSAIYFLFKSFL